jgi:hypothetical protein
MRGKVESVEAKTSGAGKTFYSIVIGGVKGSSFDEGFLKNVGNVVDYESEKNGNYTNYKLIKGEGGKAPAQSQQQAPVNQSKPVTGVEIKLLFIPKALESAINGAKLTCKDGTITSDQIMKVADAYLTWMITKGLEG